ncbi:NAD(P)H-hydrate dehydratase [Catenuloplanes sp. NPDC051500]|uniref:NAD(P)H-hydrate dehydratase n=1 Tax=Catenuloplanes sp. NPDC051500 TaxID=3363959 RepID=UPI00379F9181
MPNRSEPVAVITPRLLRDWALPVPVGGKDARGTVLVVGGSRFTPGAVLLAGVAALRAGAGVLQLAVAESTAAALSIAVPEALVAGLPETPGGSVAATAITAASTDKAAGGGKGSEGAADRPRADRLAELAAEAGVIAAGPGLDDVEETSGLLKGLLAAAGPETVFVLDAYALGALSREPDLLRDHGRTAVLTPNLTEARFLLGHDLDDDLDDAAAEIAVKYDAVVSLYGHIASRPSSGGVVRRWREETADTGLGTSGSGDVRAGILAGLISRGATPEQAACWAAWAHATAGQRLVPGHGRIGFLARELLDEISPALAVLQ